MGWLAASLAFIGVLYFAVHYTGFRKAVFGITAFLFVAIIVGLVITHVTDLRDQQERRIAKTLIDPKELYFSNTKLRLDMFPKVSGTVLNGSQHVLKEFTIRVVVTDCANVFDQFDPPHPAEPSVRENALSATPSEMVQRDWRCPCQLLLHKRAKRAEAIV